jgi:hypothetical protein
MSFRCSTYNPLLSHGSSGSFSVRHHAARSLDSVFDVFDVSVIRELWVYMCKSTTFQDGRWLARLPETHRSSVSDCRTIRHSVLGYWLRHDDAERINATRPQTSTCRYTPRVLRFYLCLDLPHVSRGAETFNSSFDALHLSKCSIHT